MKFNFVNADQFALYIPHLKMTVRKLDDGGAVIELTGSDPSGNGTIVISTDEATDMRDQFNKAFPRMTVHEGTKGSKTKA